MLIKCEDVLTEKELRDFLNKGPVIIKNINTESKNEDEKRDDIFMTKLFNSNEPILNKLRSIENAIKSKFTQPKAPRPINNGRTIKSSTKVLRKTYSSYNINRSKMRNLKIEMNKSEGKSIPKVKSEFKLNAQYSKHFNRTNKTFYNTKKRYVSQTKYNKLDSSLPNLLP